MPIPKNKPAVTVPATAAKKAAPAARARKAAPARTAAPAAQIPVAAKREKRVHSSFSMPDSQFAMLAALKTRCLAFGVSAKKGELLAAGLHMLANLPDTSLEASVLPFLRLDRKPSKDKKRKK